MLTFHRATTCLYLLSTFSLTAISATVAPSITDQPRSKMVVVGQTAPFAVTASGTDPLVYQWKRNNVAISGASTRVYTSPVTTLSDNGAKFKVVVTNAAGTTTSTEVLLTVTTSPVAPVISPQPASRTVTAGQTASFTLSATGTHPLSYQWKKNGTAISGATSSTYTTPATTITDGGTKYSVTVTNAAGSVTSTQATLTVNPPPVAPSITAQPAPRTVTAGQTASFSVTASGTATLSYQWKKNGSSISGATASSYTTPATTTTDSGANYTVTVTNTAGSIASSQATLTVNPPPVAPSISTQPASRTVTAGQTASFAVTASGTATLSFQWKKNGSSISGATSSSYTTPATATTDSGAKYSVTVTNSVGSVSSSSATLTVSQALGQIAKAGFGASTTGGAGMPIVHVTNTGNSGAGSLREALAAGNRTIVFDIAGTIHLTDYIYIKGSNITVDGSTAPAPGITITGHPIYISNGGSNIILSQFRHRGGWTLADGTRNSEGNCIVIYLNCSNIILDHLSVSNYDDEGLDIWQDNRNITVQDCIIGAGSYATHNYGFLIGNHSERVTVYRNLFHNTAYRNPAVGHDDENGTVAPYITAEIVNNVVWDYSQAATTVYWGGKGNVIGNYYYSSKIPGKTNRAVNTATDTTANGSSYASGNFSKDGSTVTGTVSAPFTVDAYAQITPSSAADAAAYVKANAGCRVGGLDATDQAIIASLSF